MTVLKHEKLKIYFLNFILEETSVPPDFHSISLITPLYALSPWQFYLSSPTKLWVPRDQIRHEQLSFLIHKILTCLFLFLCTLSSCLLTYMDSSSSCLSQPHKVCSRPYTLLPIQEFCIWNILACLSYKTSSSLLGSFQLTNKYTMISSILKIKSLP